jgi:hypothetical protein
VAKGSTEVQTFGLKAPMDQRIYSIPLRVLSASGCSVDCISTQKRQLSARPILLFHISPPYSFLFQ